MQTVVVDRRCGLSEPGEPATDRFPLPDIQGMTLQLGLESDVFLIRTEDRQ